MSGVRRSSGLTDTYLQIAGTRGNRGTPFLVYHW